MRAGRREEHDIAVIGERQATEDAPATAPETAATRHQHRSRRTIVRRALMLSDAAALVLTLLVTGLVEGGGNTIDGRELAVFALTLPLWIALASLYGLYEDGRLRADDTALDDLWPVFHAATVGMWLAFAGAHVAGEPLDVDRALAFWLMTIPALPLGRSLARVLMRRRAGFTQNTVVVGAGLVGQELARKVRRNPGYGMHLVGFVDGDPLPLHRELAHLPVLGGPEELGTILRGYGIERVLLAFTGDGHEVDLDVVRACNDYDVQVDIVPRLFEVVGSRAQFYTLQGTVLLGLTAPALRPASRLAKRGMDVVGAGLGLLLLSPALLAVAAAIKLTSPGPVFFRQTRIGKGQRPFTILKFRTMVADAEARKAEVAHLNTHLETGDARMFKIPDDPRITRVGAFLRKTSVDELPQLLNVLKGDMSLVGPRPLIVDEHRYVNDWGLRRLDLTPGLTGLWQVFGRSEVPFSQMLVLDYLYVTNWSLWGDIKLMFQTVPVLFGKTRGAV